MQRFLLSICTEAGYPNILKNRKLNLSVIFFVYRSFLLLFRRSQTSLVDLLTDFTPASELMPDFCEVNDETKESEDINNGLLNGMKKCKV